MTKKIKPFKKTPVFRKEKHRLRAGTDSAEVKLGEKQAIKWLELALAASLILFLIILHFTVLLHSGGLWRDEANSVNIINLPSIGDMWDNLPFESFPILWLLILRFWSFIGFGGTDLALRTLGLIVGLGVLGALWYALRFLGTRLPLISLVLFAMCPAVFAGDSLRAWGLGVLLILLALATMWRVLYNPTPWRMVLCAVIVILSVQCLYHNSFLIFAICMGAAAVGLYRRDWKLTAFPLGVGILAAASVVPYLGTVSRVKDWNIVVRVPIDLTWIFYKFQKAIDPSGTLLTWVWAVLALLTVITFIRLLVKSTQALSVKEKELALFLLTTMLISIIAYIAFIKILAVPTQSWYYLPLMAVMIIIIDKGADIISEGSSPGRIIRLVCVLGIVLFIFMDSWNAAHIRKTNMDMLAAKLETLAGKNDLIVVTPFYYGISFARYYRGSAAWVTLPEIADKSVHRYDLFKIKMMENEPIKPVLQKITKTLQNGHRVWVVGGLNFLRPGEAPTVLPPAPNSPYGWSEGMYMITWSQKAAFVLQTYGRTFEEISIPGVDQVNEFENVPLFKVCF
jgi:hypothetical protein